MSHDHIVKLPERVAVLGLGYVGLSLAVGFGRHTSTLGFDVDRSRVEGLRKNVDRNGELTAEALAQPHIEFSDDPKSLIDCDVFIVAVPTPIDDAKRPDLRPLISASRTVGAALKERAALGERRAIPIIVYESTVYPGCTEEDCVPVLEQASGLQRSRDFKVGYSPERINPGDEQHTLETIVKVVSAEDEPTLDIVAALYGSVVKAGVHRAPNIRTAEAAKVIENTQRDLNIALMNELSILFHQMGLDTLDVLKASETKWNFLRFRPGLVGGHCIPVDPYYLTHKAEELGLNPQVILAGRRINDGMGRYAARETVKLLVKHKLPAQGAKALVLGATFKEDVADARNTGVTDLVDELITFGLDVEVHDALIGKAGVERLGLRHVADPFAQLGSYDLVVLAVPHKAYRGRTPAQIAALLKGNGKQGVLVDLKAVLPREQMSPLVAAYWRL